MCVQKTSCILYNVILEFFLQWIFLNFFIYIFFYFVVKCDPDISLNIHLCSEKWLCESPVLHRSIEEALMQCVCVCVWVKGRSCWHSCVGVVFSPVCWVLWDRFWQSCGKRELLSCWSRRATSAPADPTAAHNNTWYQGTAEPKHPVNRPELCPLLGTLCVCVLLCNKCKKGLVSGFRVSM